MLLQFLGLPKMWNQPSIFSLTVVGRRYYLSLYETDKKKSDNKYDEHKTSSRRQNRKKQVCECEGVGCVRVCGGGGGEFGNMGN